MTDNPPTRMQRIAVQRNDAAEVLRLERESDARRAKAEQFPDEILTGSAR